MFTQELDEAIQATLTPAERMDRVNFYNGVRTYDSGPIWFEYWGRTFLSTMGMNRDKLVKAKKQFKFPSIKLPSLKRKK